MLKSSAAAFSFVSSFSLSHYSSSGSMIFVAFSMSLFPWHFVHFTMSLLPDFQSRLYSGVCYLSGDETVFVFWRGCSFFDIRDLYCVDVSGGRIPTLLLSVC